jgi:hypothetical protein
MVQLARHKTPARLRLRQKASFLKYPFCVKLGSFARLWSARNFSRHQTEKKGVE